MTSGSPFFTVNRLVGMFSSMGCLLHFLPGCQSVRAVSRGVGRLELFAGLLAGVDSQSGGSGGFAGTLHERHGLKLRNADCGLIIDTFHNSLFTN